MRSILYGLVVGLMLSALRAPLGLDLLQVPAVEASSAYGYRALALLLIAAAWWLRPSGVVTIGFLFSTAVGFALHALFVASAWSPSSATGLWVVALLGFALLVVLARGDMLNERAVSSDEPSFLTMIGTCAAGAGVAVALESVARHVRLFGAGLPQDDSISALVLLAGLLVGAIAAGWISASNRMRALALPIGLAATAAACFLPLHTIAGIQSTRGFDQYLRSYGLDTSAHGMLAYDALIAATCFILPAGVLGAALRGARSKLDLVSALLGAALGLWFVPVLMTAPEQRGTAELEIFSAQLVSFGCLTAIGGAALALLANSTRNNVARWSAIGGTLVLCLVPLNIAVSPKIVISPWMVVPPKQLLVCDSPEGLITVEPSEGELPIATLDRRELTPPTNAAPADVERIKQSIAMVPPERRLRAPGNTSGSNALRVLLVGQLTPVRAEAFKECGVEHVDRSAAWFASMKRMDAILFENMPEPLGERLSPAEARRRIKASEYDLVIVPPVPGDTPVTCNLAVPDATTLVAWFEADQWIARRNLGAQVVFSTDGADEPSVGVVVHGASAPHASISSTSSGTSGTDGGVPLIVAAGDPVCAPTPLARLQMFATERFEERDNWGRASLARRLANAAQGTPHEKLLRGFEILYAGQSRSSEFETREERLVLPDQALALFEETALAAPPTEHVRGLWEDLARVMLGKRAVTEMYKYLQPLAEKHAPWPVLEQVLAQADLESLEPRAAARRLSALIASRARAKIDSESLAGDGPSATELARARQTDLELWFWLGDAQRQAGEHADAAQSWRRALALQPENRALRRELAKELVRAKDPDGTKMVGELLAEKPDDSELAIFQGPGPYPDSPGGSVTSQYQKHGKHKAH